MRMSKRLLALSLTAGLLGTLSRADGKPADTEATSHNEALLKWMQTYSEGTTVRVGGGEDAVEAEMVERPVFRYSDPQRFIPDATLWVWSHEGRPVAFQKVEVDARPGVKQWTICFASLSEGLLDVEWPAQPERRTYHATAPGVRFKPIPEAREPASSAPLRSIQMKRLTARFEGRLDLWEGGTSRIRVIPRPIFEYRDAATDLPVGAIFGLTSTGTNPDVLLLVEVRENADGQLQWEYACTRMTTAGLELLLDDEAVQKTSRAAVYGNVNAFDNWIFHFLPRQLEVTPE